MSLWGKLGGIALGVVGAVTGQPGLIAAGASVLGTDIASEGAKKASDQQVAAAEKAKAEANALYNDTRTEQRRVFENSNAAFQPYIQLGQGTLPTLGSMVGMEFTPSMNAAAAPAEAPGAPPPLPVQARQPMEQSPADVRAAMQTQSSYETKRGQPGPMQGGLGLAEMGGRGRVLVMSPDGSERRLLPRRLADEAIAAGAREIG